MLQFAIFKGCLARTKFLNCICPPTFALQSKALEIVQIPELEVKNSEVGDKKGERGG